MLVLTDVLRQHDEPPVAPQDEILVEFGIYDDSSPASPVAALTYHGALHWSCSSQLIGTRIAATR